MDRQSLCIQDLLIMDFYQTIKFPFAECMGEALNVYMAFPVDETTYYYPRELPCLHLSALYIGML